jgi:hypothetical protein
MDNLTERNGAKRRSQTRHGTFDLPSIHSRPSSLSYSASSITRSSSTSPICHSLSSIAARRRRGRGVVAVAGAAVVVGGTCREKLEGQFGVFTGDQRECEERRSRRGPRRKIFPFLPLGLE